MNHREISHRMCIPVLWSSNEQARPYAQVGVRQGGAEVFLQAAPVLAAQHV